MIGLRYKKFLAKSILYAYISYSHLGTDQMTMGAHLTYLYNWVDQCTTELAKHTSYVGTDHIIIKLVFIEVVIPLGNIICTNRSENSL
jgi:hypothetical protein